MLLFRMFYKFVQKYIPHIITLLLLAGVIIIDRSIPDEKLIDLVTNSGSWAPFIYILIQIAGQICAPISTTPLFLLGYKLFPEQFIFYTMIISCTTSVVNFAIARRWGRKIVAKLATEDGMSKIDNLLAKFRGKSLFIIRVFASGMNDFASYAFGLTTMNIYSYLIASLIGNMLMVVIWKIFISSGSSNIYIFTLKFLISYLPFILVLSFYLLDKKEPNPKP